jgi:valyl-tRNA synthetase
MLAKYLLFKAFFSIIYCIMSELPKAYEPQKYEDKIYKRWEESGFFNPDVCVAKGICEKDAKPFTVVLPPPNATGSLHIGHAMMLAIEDLMVRYHRMKGDKSLWLPGTDHAAIATNAIVEKLLLIEGMTKHDLGREKYIEKVKDYIKNSQDNIRNQVRKMGSSLDWSREAYTWDENRNLAVRTMFKKMYDDGLIYRGNRIVNWCPHCHSTLADDEVVYKEEIGKFYWIKYGPFILATARPETKLGDTAVAVHPKDKRYKKMVGKKFMIPGVLGEFEIIVVADEVVDPEFGTGAVKVTPFHSFIDYDIAQRHNLPGKQIIDEDGRMMANCGKYAGMTTKEARDVIVADMQSKGLIDHIEENYVHNIGTCYRCKSVIEPIPSKQWFIDVNKEFNFKQSVNNPIEGLKNGQAMTLKKLMQQVVNNGQIKIIPDRFNKTYFHWIDNLRDWCISRQIWVGHQIPVWYKGEEIFVDVEPPTGDGWQQDPDNLDTWFSAGLWTFSTLGWPDIKSEDLKTYHPTAVLETMFDILFFWVARMIMMTTYGLGEVPFKTVYLHAKVLDKDGEKMSKSKPETMIDPLDVCKKYGTDAVRLSLLLGISPGADVRLSEEKIAGFRNFANKLWNIARFILTQIDADSLQIDTDYKISLKGKTLSDAWILDRLERVRSAVTKNIEEYNFSYAGEILRDFTWNELADWYLEIAKIEGNVSLPLNKGDVGGGKNSKAEILNYILNTILKLWHPFIPFVTETIWHEVYGQEKMLMIETWPDINPTFSKGDYFYYSLDKPVNTMAEDDFVILQKIVTNIRFLRSDNKIDPAKKLKAVISAGKQTNLIENNSKIIKSLARLEEIQINQLTNKPINSVSFVQSGVEVFLDLAGAVDLEKEKERIKKESEELKKYIAGLENKLANEDFVKNAPKEIVDKEKIKLNEAKIKIEKINH